MRKLFLTVMMFAASAAMLFAQTEPISAVSLGSQGGEKGFFIALQGGALVSANENTWTYGDNHETEELFSLQAGLALGYTFSPKWAARVMVEYGKNASGGNTDQAHPFGPNTPHYYPYEFKSLSIFADAIFTIPAPTFKWIPKVYAGIGGAHTYGFADTMYGTQEQYAWHPWQEHGWSHHVPAFRLGFIPQYDLNDKVSIYADFCGEFYGDNFNGLKGGISMDFRGMLSLGVQCRL